MKTVRDTDFASFPGVVTVTGATALTGAERIVKIEIPATSAGNYAVTLPPLAETIDRDMVLLFQRAANWANGSVRIVSPSGVTFNGSPDAPVSTAGRMVFRNVGGVGYERIDAGAGSGAGDDLLLGDLSDEMKVVFNDMIPGDMVIISFGNTAAVLFTAVAFGGEDILTGKFEVGADAPSVASDKVAAASFVRMFNAHLANFPDPTILVVDYIAGTNEITFNAATHWLAGFAATAEGAMHVGVQFFTHYGVAYRDTLGDWVKKMRADYGTGFVVPIGINFDGVVAGKTITFSISALGQSDRTVTCRCINYGQVSAQPVPSGPQAGEYQFCMGDTGNEDAGAAENMYDALGVWLEASHSTQYATLSYLEGEKSFTVETSFMNAMNWTVDENSGMAISEPMLLMDGVLGMVFLAFAAMGVSESLQALENQSLQAAIDAHELLTGDGLQQVKVKFLAGRAVGDKISVGFPIPNFADGDYDMSGLKECEIVLADGWPHLAAHVTCTSVNEGDTLSVSIGQTGGASPTVHVLTAVDGGATWADGEFDMSGTDNETAASLAGAAALLAGVTSEVVSSPSDEVRIIMTGPYILTVAAGSGMGGRLVCVNPDTFTFNIGSTVTNTRDAFNVLVNYNNFQPASGARPMLTATTENIDATILETDQLLWILMDKDGVVTDANAHLEVDFFPYGICAAGNMTRRDLENHILRINQWLRIKALEFGHPS